MFPLHGFDLFHLMVISVTVTVNLNHTAGGAAERNTNLDMDCCCCASVVDSSGLERPGCAAEPGRRLNYAGIINSRFAAAATAHTHFQRLHGASTWSVINPAQPSLSLRTPQRTVEQLTARLYHSCFFARKPRSLHYRHWVMMYRHFGPRTLLYQCRIVHKTLRRTVLGPKCLYTVRRTPW